MLLVASFCSLQYFLEMKMKFSNSLFVEISCLLKYFLNETTITGKKYVSESSLLTCPVQVYDSMPTRRLTWENIRRAGADAKLVTSLPHSLLLSLSLLYLHLVCLHLSSVCVIFHVGVSCPFSSTHLLCLSFCSSRLHLFLSLALLVWLLLALFFSWLPAHSFLYACLLTNGCGRCSPRCL